MYLTDTPLNSLFRKSVNSYKMIQFFSQLRLNNRKLALGLGFLLPYLLQAQISGTVFRDYNGNGTHETTAPTIEPGIANVVINAYNAANVLLTTTTSSTTGTYSMAYTVSVRVEFVLPASGNCVNPAEDFSSFGSGGNNVRFITASTAGLDYAVNHAADYINNTNPEVYVPQSVSGDPLGGGNAGTYPAFKGHPYNLAGNPATSTNTLAFSQIGSTWGVAYSKQAGKIFTSAFLKRHTGFGAIGSGGIYMLTPTATSFTVDTFYNMDVAGYRTRAAVGAPAYGNGTSFTIGGGGTTISYLGAIDPASNAPVGLGVIGANGAGGRLLPIDINVDNYDAAAFGQVGKVGLGDLEISDDGLYLFVMNLYDRKLYRLTLNNAYNPTAVIGVSSYDLPTIAVTNGVLRAFGIRYHRGEMYVGAVSTGENGGQNVVPNGATDLYGYVFELNNPTGSAAFNTSPVISYPLNYRKGYTINGSITQWYPWTSSTSVLFDVGGEQGYPTPMLTNIDFTDNGDMIMDFTDRSGHQWGYNNYMDLSTTNRQASLDIGGDILIAGRNCGTGAFSLENNGSYNSNGTTFTSLGAGNNEGPGGGEFFYKEVPPDNYHHETSQGALAILPGAQTALVTMMDPASPFSGGTAHFSTVDGTSSTLANLYLGVNEGAFSKANGLGDIEMAGVEAPIEIGNRVWNDYNGDGIQGATETGIANVSIALFADFDNDNLPDGAALATTLTSAVAGDALGTWYFNVSNVADGDPITLGNQTGIQVGKNYLLQINNTAWSGGIGQGVLSNLFLTQSNIGGAGQPDVRDNDGTFVNNIPQIPFFVAGAGQNSHTYDFGFAAKGSIGDYVWNDLDKDGVQDANEVGVSGVIVTLYDNAGNPVTSTVTDAYGHYLFTFVPAGTYTLGFSLPIDYTFSPKDNGGNDNTDSDINLATGHTDNIVLNAGENITNIDAGVYYTVPVKSILGDYVWYDTNANGIQEAGEKGVAGLTVTLYNNAGLPVMTTVTDGNGAYHFAIFTAGNYSVGFSLPIGYTFTTPNNTADNNDSDASNTAGATFGKTAQVTIVLGTDILTLDAGIIPAASTTASIGDFVWYDLNQDGLQDNNENGISGVLVTLKDAAGATVATTYTDALGYYIFNNVPAGTYSVTFTAPSGYTFSANNNGNGINDSDANPTDGTTPLFTVRGGEDRTDIDAGLYQSTSITNAALGNYVWFDANKNGIQDATESGVAGVTVTLLDTSRIAIASTMTDANGFYLFPNLVAGDYSVAFSNLPQGYVFTTANQGTDATDSDALQNGETYPVTLMAGDRYLDFDAGITLGGTSGGTASLGNFVWNDANTDGIQNDNEVGVGGVLVTLYQMDGTTVITTTTTDDLGYYVFNSLPSGVYFVGFSQIPTGFFFTNAIQGGDTLLDSDVDNAGMSRVIVLGDGQNDMSIDAGIYTSVKDVSVGDFVWNDQNADGIQDPNEVGMPNVIVTLYDNANNPMATTITDENGYYLFLNFPAGTYTIGFSGLPTGYSFSPTGQGAANEDSDANPSNGLTAPFTLMLGDHITDIDAGLISTRALIGNFVWEDLNRNGRQDAGEPGISGVTVTLYDNSNTPVAQAVTNEQGEYYFSNINPGTYTLGFTTIPVGMIFTLANATADNTDSDAEANGIIPAFTVVAGEVNLTFDAGLITPPKGGLSGYVWYDKDKDGVQDAGELPAGGITVILYASDGTTIIATTVTTGNGQYVFDNLPTGDYIIGFSTLPNGYVLTNPNAGGDDMIDSDANTITFQSGVYAVVEGVRTEAADAGLIKATQNVGDFVWKDNDKDGIQDAGEPGVSGVTVSLYTSTGTLISVVKTDASGHYLFQDIPAGNYEIGFSLPIDYVFSPTTGGNESTDSDAGGNGKTGIFAVTIGADTLGIDAGIYFKENISAGLGNYVWLDSDGNGIQNVTEHGVAGVTVTLFSGAGTAIQTTITDNNGFYQFQNLIPANYFLGFTLPVGYLFTAQDATTDALDSDVNPTTGRTIITNLLAEEQDMTWDAGIVLQPAASASIGDFVWNDLNQNGIQEAGEPGLCCVQVNLYSETGTLVATTYTDAFGNYIFTNVSAGAYYITFTVPAGYSISPQNQGTDDETDSDINLAGTTAIFIVSPGDRLTDIDAGMYETSPLGTAALGDYVWFDTNNNGAQDLNEQGVGGVTVTLLNASLSPIATTVTAANGYYLFVNLVQTNYYVRFSNLPDGYSFTTKDAGGPDASDSDANKGNGQTDLINLNVALNPTIDAGLVIQANEGGNGSIGDFVWYDANRDGVQDATETGISGIIVTLTNISTSAVTILTTDGTGHYLFNNLDAGQYQITFTLPSGYAFSTPDIGSDDTDSDANISGNTPVITLGQGETNVSLDAGMYKPALLNPAALGDRVWLDANKNGRQDIGEIDVTGVTITLYDAGMNVVAVTATDANGLYMFNGLTAGIYTVGFSNLPDGFFFTKKDKGTDDTDSDADGNTGLANAVLLAASEIRTDVDAGIYSDIKAALGNYVWYDTDNDGIQNNSPQGVNAVTVVLFDAGNVEIASTVTDINGYYFFPNLDANTYTVGFSTLPNGARFTLPNIGADDTDSDADLTGLSGALPLSAGEVNLTLDAGIGTALPASLYGYVWYDYQNAILATNNNGIQNTGEKPVAGVTVTLLDASNNLVATAITGANGMYFFGNLSAGTYSILFSTVPNGVKWTTPNQGGSDMLDSDAIPLTTTTANGGSYTVAAGENKEAADAGLIPPASLSGIAFMDGKPNAVNTADGIRNYQIPTDNTSGLDAGLGAVWVLLLDENKNIIRSMRTGEDGRYIFRGLESGKKYFVAFESLPSGCATCDFTSYNNLITNDSTDSDVDSSKYVNYSGKNYMFADSVEALLPFELRPNIDAGYRQPGSAFPIELLSLTAVWQGQDGLVEWVTSTEANSAYFGVERSLDGGRSFSWLGNVVAAGNSSTERKYSFIDVAIAAQTTDKVYYRLKLVDLDATYKYSQKAELRISTVETEVYFNVYPNPTQDLLYVDYHVSEGSRIEFRLVNAIGQIVFSALVENQDLPKTIYFDMRDYASGVYMIQLNTNTKTLTKKIVKE